MKSLLNRTLVQFIISTVIVLLLATPVFYLLTKHFYAEDMIDLMEAMERGDKIPHLDLEKDILQGMMIQFFLVFSVLICSMLITLRVITRKLWHPFDDTLKKMEQYNLEQTEPSFLDTHIKEFRRLNNSVGLLIKRNRESYLSQKEFTENASHELQTPLAIAQSKLDLLLQEDLNENQSAIVGDLYNAVNRMSRLNKNLLLLARIENAQYCDRMQINICQFIDKQLPLFENLRGYESSISFEHNAEDIMIKANEVLLESMLNNLVINAIRHSSDNRKLSITADCHSLIVKNTANSGPLDEKLLFRRFQFTDNQKRGNGLGLAIVKAICDFHGWSIHYEFKKGCHCFTVEFNQV